jgi:hypothetical protein
MVSRSGAAWVIDGRLDLVRPLNPVGHGITKLILSHGRRPCHLGLNLAVG